MLEIFRNSNLQEKEPIKILKQVTTMKDSGKKICSMVRDIKDIQIETNIEDSLCVAANLGKDNINLQMGKFIKARFIMDIAMAMAYLHFQMAISMMVNGDLAKCMAEEFTNGKMDKNIKDNMRTA